MLNETTRIVYKEAVKQVFNLNPFISDIINYIILPALIVIIGFILIKYKQDVLDYIERLKAKKGFIKIKMIMK